MSQQDIHKTAKDGFKRRLFIETGVGYRTIANTSGFDETGSKRIGRIVEEYLPPRPSLRTNEIKLLNAPSVIHGSGRLAYRIGLRVLFPDQETYHAFLFYAANPLKFYDENGGIYTGALAESPEITRVEAGQRYDVKLALIAVKKEDYEQEGKCEFTDIDGTDKEQDIREMAYAGLITQMDRNGNYVYNFRPEALVTRAECTAFLNRTLKYIERVLRG